MAILSKGYKPDNFESHNSQKKKEKQLTKALSTNEYYVAIDKVNKVNKYCNYQRLISARLHERSNIVPVY